MIWQTNSHSPGKEDPYIYIHIYIYTREQKKKTKFAMTI